MTKKEGLTAYVFLTAHHLNLLMIWQGEIDDELEEYDIGDEYRPEAEEVEADTAFANPQTRTPLKPQPFMVLETPFMNILQ